MLTVNDLIEQFDVQGKYVVCAVNKYGDKYTTPDNRLYDCEIQYMYAENDVLYIEVRDYKNN